MTSLPEEALSGRKIRVTFHFSGVAKERLAAIIPSCPLELLANDSPCRQSGAPSGFFEPSRELFRKTHGDCVSHSS